jgi:hypothetical protein
VTTTTDHQDQVDDTSTAMFVPGPKTQTFQIGHDELNGFYLEVEQNMDGELLLQIFGMIERQFGLAVVDEEDNDAIILDNGNIRIFLEPMGDDV